MVDGSRALGKFAPGRPRNRLGRHPDAMNRLGFLPSRMTLGAVQLGMPYGIANRQGQPDDTETDAILDRADRGGVTVIDTARAYGNSEPRIGRWRAERGRSDIRLVTKVPPLPAGSPHERRIALYEHLSASKAALQVKCLDLVLVHRETDLLDPAIVDSFQQAVADGKIAAFGASLYHPQNGLELLEKVPLAAIQLPASLVDDRFQRAGVFAAAQERSVVVFVRSAFLQGALLMEPESLPPHLMGLREPINMVRDFAQRQQRPLIEILVLAVRDIPGATSVVIGVERAQQLDACLAAINASPIDPAALVLLRQRIGCIPEAAVDPSTWPR